jgi:lambda family phage portal protein
MLAQGEIVGPDRIFSVAGRFFENLETHQGSLIYRPATTSKNIEIKIARAEIVRQARHTERFSELIRGGLDRKADLVVGVRLRLHPQPDFAFLRIDDPAARKKFIAQAKSAFNNWAYDSRKLCDAEGHYDFSGMMWMAARNLEGPDGECAGVIHFDEARRAKYNTIWGTFVTVIDPDRIETPPERAADPDVFEGQRLDEHSRTIGMWFRRRHASEGLDPRAISRTHEFVFRETKWGRPMLFHHFVKTRGGQKRGITNLVTILRRTGMLDAFDTNYVAASGIAAETLTYIKTKSSAAAIAEALAPAGGQAVAQTGGVVAGGWGFFEEKVDYYDKRKFKIGRDNQRLAVLAPDDEIVTAAIDRALADPSPFRAPFLREQASSIGVPISLFSQNYSDTNYSSERASRLDAHSGVLRTRAHFAAAAPDLIYSAVLEEAIDLGLIDWDPSWPPFQENRAAYVAAGWSGPGIGSIEPLKEANAAKTLIEKKLRSRTRINAEVFGDDYLDVLDEIDAEYEEAEARDIMLDGPAPGAMLGGDGAAAAETSKSGVPKTRRGAGANRDGDNDGIVDEEKD